jgi:hypothetical protein
MPASSPHGGVTESVRHGPLAMVTTELCLYATSKAQVPQRHTREASERTLC